MALSYPHGPVNLSIRPWKNIHTALSYGPVRLFNKSVTNWLFLYWPWYRFSVSSIGPSPTGLGANTAHLESIPGPIQKQPVSNNILWKDSLNSDGNTFHQYYQNEQSLFMLIELAEHKKKTTTYDVCKSKS